MLKQLKPDALYVITDKREALHVWVFGSDYKSDHISRMFKVLGTSNYPSGVCHCAHL